MATPPVLSDHAAAPGVASDQGGGLELSAAAKESFGFADDQFMELSTSGASIYDLPILSEPSSSSSGRLNQSGGSSSNGSLRRVLLGQAAAAQPQNKARDESTLSQSGMSLASLGSLSRSARRPSGLYNVDEALDDSIAWRGGLKPSEEAETREIKGIPERSEHKHHTSRKPGAADHLGSHGEEGRLDEGRKRAHREGFPPPARGAAAGQSMFTSSSSPRGEGHGGILQPGRVQDLSARVAELRQKSYQRRLASAPGTQRNHNSPPPLPVGVDLAPPEPPFAAVTPQHPRNVSPVPFLNPVDHGKRLPSQAAAGAEAWGGGGAVLKLPSAGSDSHDGGASGGGSGGHNSSGSNNSGTSSKVRKKGARRAAAARVFMRTIGMGPGKQAAAAAATAAPAAPAAPAAAAGQESAVASGEGDGGSSVTSWSADSSLQGSAARGTSSSPGNSSSPAAAPHLAVSGGGGGGGSGGLGALSESSPTSCSTSAGAGTTAGGAEAAAPSSQLETIERRGGLRGRLGQVWSSRRGKKGDGLCTQPTSEGEMAMRSVVLQPAGDGEVGFAFLPAAQGPPTADGGGGLSPAPILLPDWLRSHSAPAGSAVDEGKVDDMDGSSLFPTTPLGRSNRSFDPNLSPTTYDADGSNVPLPPPLGSRSAAESLGASFDPNRSTRSWFDFSGSGMSVSRPAQMLAEIWQEHPELLEGGGQQSSLRPSPFPESSSAEDREARAAAAAAALAAATTALESSTSTTTTTQHTAASSTAGARAATLSPPLFDEDALVAELSDLSVSDGRRSKKRSQSAAAVAAGGGGGPVSSVSSSATELQPEQMARAAEAGTAARLVAAQQSWVAGSGGGPATARETSALIVSSSMPQPDGDGTWHSNNSINAVGGGGGGGGGQENLGSLGVWSASSLRPSGSQHQSAEGAHGCSSAAAASAGWPASASSSTGSLPGGEAPSGHGGTGAAVPAADDRADFMAGIAGAPPIGLGHVPTVAPAMIDRGVRARSVDVGVLQQMALARDQLAWTNGGGDQGSQWSSVWPAQLGSADSGAASSASGCTVSGNGSNAPLAFPQRSASVDDTGLSMSTSRSSRLGDIGGGGGGNSGVRASLPVAGSGAFGGVGHTLQAHDAGSALTTAAAASSATVEGDDRLCAPSLPEGLGGQGRLAAAVAAAVVTGGGGGGEAGVGPNQRASWSALHAMIPMPGVSSSSNAPRRASESVVSAASAGQGGGEDARAGDAVDKGGPSGAGRGGGGLTLLGRRKQQPQLGAPDSQEMLSKRRLTPSRVLDIFGKHKKQCLDGMMPVAPTEDPKGNAFEPFDFLRGKFGGSSSSASLTMAPSSSSSFPGAEPSTVPEVAEPGKKTRQAVAARRPRDRGRFMKSQQKWVTQGELKQTKYTGGEAGGGGTEGGAGEEVALG